MPIYEFKCSGCGETEEYVLSMGAEPDNCYSCDGTGPFTKQVSMFSAHTSNKGPGQSPENHGPVGIIIPVNSSEIPEGAKLIAEKKVILSNNAEASFKLFQKDVRPRDSGPSLDACLN